MAALATGESMSFEGENMRDVLIPAISEYLHDYERIIEEAIRKHEEKK